MHPELLDRGGVHVKVVAAGYSGLVDFMWKLRLVGKVGRLVGRYFDSSGQQILK